MARPRLHDEAAGDALLDSAAELLRTGGPEALSVRGVADHSGRSFRAVYALFGSKQALVDALAERGYLDLAARVNGRDATRDAALDLVEAGLAFRSFAVEHPGLFRLTFEQVSANVLQQKQVARAAYASYDALVTWISRARSAGLIHPSRTDEATAFGFHSLCQGLASCELAAQPPPGPGFWPMMRGQDLGAAWRDALGAFVAGLASAPRGK